MTEPSETDVVQIEFDVVVERYLGARLDEDGQEFVMVVETEEGCAEIVFPLNALARRVYRVLAGSDEG